MCTQTLVGEWKWWLWGQVPWGELGFYPAFPCLVLLGVVSSLTLHQRLLSPGWRLTDQGQGRCLHPPGNPATCRRHIIQSLSPQPFFFGVTVRWLKAEIGAVVGCYMGPGAGRSWSGGLPDRMASSNSPSGLTPLCLVPPLTLLPWEREDNGITGKRSSGRGHPCLVTGRPSRRSWSRPVAELGRPSGASHCGGCPTKPHWPSSSVWASLVIPHGSLSPERTHDSLLTAQWPVTVGWGRSDPIPWTQWHCHPRWSPLYYADPVASMACW